MFIVWKGWGIVGILIPIIVIFIVHSITTMLFGDEYKNNSLILALELVISAIPIYFIGIKLNKKVGQIVIIKETNEEIELKETHSLFWIPLQYWSFIIFALGIFFATTKTISQ